MVHQHKMAKVAQGFFEELEVPAFDLPAWTEPAPAADRRVAIVSSAGLSQRGDKPFSWVARDYRAFPADDRDLVMTHVAVDYDRTGWQQDINTILPLDRLREMAADGEIGSVAETHYSFMGATDPLEMEKSAREVADRMKQEAVDTVFLIPV
jgi:D-proline reductase (dithiol) PrdB